MRRQFSKSTCSSLHGPVFNLLLSFRSILLRFCYFPQMQNFQAPLSFSPPHRSHSSCLASVLQGPNFRITHTPPPPLCHGKESYWGLPVFPWMISGVHPFFSLISTIAHFMLIPRQLDPGWQHCLTVLPAPDLFLMSTLLYLNYDPKFLLLS